MPDGKPAGIMCVNLDPLSYRCRIWGSALYPDTCRRFSAEKSVCGENRDEALEIISLLERQTAPDQCSLWRNKPSE